MSRKTVMLARSSAMRCSCFSTTGTEEHECPLSVPLSRVLFPYGGQGYEFALPSGAPPLVTPGLEAGPEPDIDYDALVTEDHKPVDRIFVEKLYRLLTRPLYASWPGPGAGRPFLILVNVGWFYQRQHAGSRARLPIEP